MAKGRFHLTFPEELIQEPLIYTVGKQFDVVTNIRRANIEERVGWVILEMEGSEQTLEEAVAYLAERGVQVDRIDGSVLEG
ncbi:MAG: NIL domain-containing protein [Actinomycetota bacterium]